MAFVSTSTCGSRARARTSGEQLGERAARRAVRAHDAEPGAGHRLERLAVGGEDVLAVAQEREVLGRQPAQQVDRLRDLGRRRPMPASTARARRPATSRGPASAASPRPPRGRRGARAGSATSMPRRLARRPSPGRSRRASTTRRPRPSGTGSSSSSTAITSMQRPGDVAAYDELRVDHEVDRAALHAEARRDRVDEERHVVGDDLEDACGPADQPWPSTDGVNACTTAVPCGRLLRGPAVADHRTEHVDRVAAEEVLGSRVAVVAPHERARGRAVLGGAVPVSRARSRRSALASSSRRAAAPAVRAVDRPPDSGLVGVSVSVTSTLSGTTRRLFALGRSHAVVRPRSP